MFGASRFGINLSVALALAYESVLKRDDLHGIITLQEATELVGFLCNNAVRCEISLRLRPLTQDPGDDLAAELAIISACDFLITHNTRHLLPLRAHNIEVVTPGRFLAKLREMP